MALFDYVCLTWAALCTGFAYVITRGSRRMADEAITNFGLLEGIVDEHMRTCHPGLLEDADGEA